MASVEVNQDELMRLLRSVAKKDRQAFQQLYSQVAARMFGLCVKLANHRELAEEAMQESFIQIWHHAGEYHRDRGAPLAWMMTIATSGAAILARGAISPGWFMPISITANSVSAGIRASVRGTPQ